MSSNQPSYPVIESAKNLKRSFSGQRVVRERQQTTSVVYGFGINSSALLVEHTDMLEKNIVFLLEYPDSAVVSVVGRASQTGPEANNRQLARDRAGGPPPRQQPQAHRVGHRLGAARDPRAR